MKKVYLFALIVIPFLTSCEDEAEELTTITQEITLTEIVPVVASGAQTVPTINGSFQAGANSEYANFGDKIEDVVVKSITITVLDNASYSNPNDASIVDSEVSFEFTGGSVSATLSDQNIAAALGVAIPAGFSQSQLENLASQLLSSDEISYSAFAEVSDAVTFDMEISIVLDVSGSIIN